MAQTAVDWLAEQIKEYDYAPITNTDEYAIVIPVWIFKDKLNQAKAMDKEQMIDFAAQVSYGIGVSKDEMKKVAEQYYDKTYNK